MASARLVIYKPSSLPSRVTLICCPSADTRPTSRSPRDRARLAARAHRLLLGRAAIHSPSVRFSLARLSRLPKKVVIKQV